MKSKISILLAVFVVDFIKVKGENLAGISAYNIIHHHKKNVLSVKGRVNNSSLIKQGNIIENQQYNY